MFLILPYAEILRNLCEESILDNLDFLIFRIMELSLYCETSSGGVPSEL